MYEIREVGGKRAVMHDEETLEFFILGENATYNGEKPKVFRTDDLEAAQAVLECFGGDYGNFEIVESK